MTFKNRNRFARVLAGGALVLALAGPAVAADSGAVAPRTGTERQTKAAPASGGPSIFQILANWGPVLSSQQRQYDLNSDGMVNFADVLRRIAGL
ncbi:MAG: hypothetical protein GY715_15550 [Planctomycetes bacterium]|nr:hypothetical protein [Planctomycetota bacterium]